MQSFIGHATWVTNCQYFTLEKRQANAAGDGAETGRIIERIDESKNRVLCYQQTINNGHLFSQLRLWDYKPRDDLRAPDQCWRSEDNFCVFGEKIARLCVWLLLVSLFGVVSVHDICMFLVLIILRVSIKVGETRKAQKQHCELLVKKSEPKLFWHQQHFNLDKTTTTTAISW